MVRYKRWNRYDPHRSFLPTLHYQNMAWQFNGCQHGDPAFVAGEAAGSIHGRNRLMGNSLLDICVFGRRVASLRMGQHGQPAAPTLPVCGVCQAQAGLHDDASSCHC
jgi:succinate dehydrogenase/fumarate reductase flavoprotein subunit